jgi:16S rRNA (adenine1518-N6/adenine1519-N6)-dimethyltransferase
MDRITPKKSLGQHFLTDRNIAAKIVREFAARPEDPVVEIGPGEGALTGLLVEQGIRPVTIEVDPRAAESLRARYGTAIEVVEADVLKSDLRAIASRHGVEKLRVIGNIPYYITSPILFHLFDQREVIADALLMMQREVADRLVARPRTKEYGILSVITQTYSKPRLLFNVGPRCFYPPPRVNSAVIRLEFEDREGIKGIEREHRDIVRGAFGQRRKTLRNSLAHLVSIEEERGTILEGAAISPAQRAEELSPDDFIRLARVFADAQARKRGRAQA